ncbi:MAG: family 10 glycosylhydrolase [Bryobacteraceae bacterium]|nr:family 10 glycosylhydrolase [Bryobacteraceae bacterium]
MRLAALALAVALCAPAGEYRAFWADAFHVGYKTPAEVDAMVEAVAAARGNAILIEVRHRGGAYFLKRIEPQTEDAGWQQGFDALAYTIEKAHARGIEVHAWYPVTPLWDLTRTPVDPKHAWNLHGPNVSGDEFWLTTTAAGKMSRSVDPGHPDVVRHLAEVIVDPLRHYELDGVHLDYIRYPEDDRYGYNPTSLARFRRLHNREGIPADTDAAWQEFRRRQVTDLVRQVYLRSYEIRPQAKVSAALITWGNGPGNDAEFRSKDAYSRVYQNWPAWLEEGILDIGMPMNYFAERTNGALLDRWLAFEKTKQFGRLITPGLGVYLSSIPESVSQLRRVRQTGLPGVVFYSYASTNSLQSNGAPTVPNAEFYAAVAGVFGEAVASPEMPWKSAASGRGHVMGLLSVEDGPAWLKDDVEVTIQSDTNPDAIHRRRTDSTGFFGAVDLPPDRWYVRLSRAGQELFRTVPLDLAAGQSIRFDVFLRAADFGGVVPVIEGVEVRAEGLALTMRNLLVEPAAGRAKVLAGTQVLVNGAAVDITGIGPGWIETSLPQAAVDGTWRIQVRYAGLESSVMEVAGSVR